MPIDLIIDVLLLAFVAVYMVAVFLLGKRRSREDRCIRCGKELGRASNPEDVSATLFDDFSSDNLQRVRRTMCPSCVQVTIHNRYFFALLCVAVCCLAIVRGAYFVGIHTSAGRFQAGELVVLVAALIFVAWPARVARGLRRALLRAEKRQAEEIEEEERAKDRRRKHTHVSD